MVQRHKIHVRPEGHKLSHETAQNLRAKLSQDPGYELVFSQIARLDDPPEEVLARVFEIRAALEPELTRAGYTHQVEVGTESYNMVVLHRSKADSTPPATPAPPPPDRLGALTRLSKGRNTQA